MKKILLMAFKFPPYAGVGAYRWAQLSKYLAQLNYEVHVVTVHWAQTGPNTLTDIVNHPNIYIHRIPSSFPHNLLAKQPKIKLVRFAKNRLFSLVEKLFFPVDQAQRWSRHLIPYCERLIKEKHINVAVATGHPFSVNYQAAQFKLKNPNIILIQDFRDLWASDRISQVSSKFKRKLVALEKFSLKYADAAVSVTEGYRAQFEKNSEVPVYLIENGYDPGLFEHVVENNPFNKNIYHMVYLGNAFAGREECCDIFLGYLQKNTPPIKVTFIGSMPKFVKTKYAELIDKGICVFLNPMSHNESIDRLFEADFALHFNARGVPEALSTKVYEYAAARKPIISCNFGGEIERLITSHKWGLSINLATDDIATKMSSFLAGQSCVYFDNAQIITYSYPALAKKYDQLISNLTNSKL